MDRLKHMKESLFNRIDAEIARGLDNVDTKELGEAIDMVKDLSEAMYYCSIVEAMEEREEESKIMEKHYSQTMGKYPPYQMSEEYNNSGRMNYDGNRMMYYDGNGGGSRGYTYPPMEMRDYREGKSPITRRNYMESKELKHDKTKQMQELDKYVQELTEDVLEMIHDATPEEKLSLSQKMTALANKIR
jgi:hypothetical protein